MSSASAGGRVRPDLVVVNPGGRSRVYQALGAELSAIETPVWAGLIATFARGQGLGVELLDANAEELSPEEVADRLADMNPRLVAIVVYGQQPSASTQTMPAAGALCRTIRERAPSLKTVLVGGHVAALPRRTMEEEAVDFVAGGEGLHTVVELAQALAAGGSLSSVRGLWYREDGVVRENAPAPLVSDLAAAMPAPAWDLMPMERYRAHNWHAFGEPSRMPYAALYTTLGCPYHCSFCCIQAPFKQGEGAIGLKEAINSYRYWPVEAVIRDLERLVETYGVKNVKIADEMFVLNPKHVGEICDAIIARGWDLNIWAYARVDTVKDGMLDKLKRAGFNWLAFGVESANEKVRDDARKGYGQDLIYKTIQGVRAAGIHVIANYIFGLPEDDLASMQETLDLALDLNCEFANFYSAMAYPGSPLYEMAQREGWALPASWSGYSQHSVDSLPLPTRHLPAHEVLKFRDHAFQVYFDAPRYREMVSTTFGPAVAEEVARMSAVPLVRQHVR